MLIHAHRSLVGRGCKQSCSTQGFLHYSYGRHRTSCRYIGLVLCSKRLDSKDTWRVWFQYPRFVRMGTVGRPQQCSNHSWCSSSVHRMYWQVGSVPTAHLVARRDGRSNTCQLALALLHDGCGRCLPGCSFVPRVLRGNEHSPQQGESHCSHWWRHDCHRCSVGIRANRHQEGARVFNGVAVGLHDDGSWRWRMVASGIPHLHSRIL